MSSLSHVYRLHRLPQPCGEYRWCAEPMEKGAGEAVSAERFSSLLTTIAACHGPDVFVGLIFMHGLVSARSMAAQPAAAWWIRGEQEEEVEASPLDLFWRREWLPIAWWGRLGEMPSHCDPDLPLLEAARCWMLSGAKDKLPAVHLFPSIDRFETDAAAFGIGQNTVLRSWLQQGRRREFLAAVRKREAAHGQLQSHRLSKLRDATVVQRQTLSATSASDRGRWRLAPSGEVLSEAVDGAHLATRIADVDAVTLDLFDTILIRRVARPVDVFWLLGHALEQETGLSPEDFAALRAQSEQEIRSEGLRAGTVEDISLAQIYKRIAERLAVPEQSANWAFAEVALEDRVLVIHPEFARWKHVLLSKARLCLSEMYLPASVLSKWLHTKASIQGVELWTSGETGLSKGSGKLFEKAGAALGCAPERILHLGDNLASDVEVPSRLGWKAHYWEARRACRLDQPEPWSPADPLSSVALGFLRAERRPEASLAWQVGFELLGPVVWSWIHHLARQPSIRESSEVWLLARDGYWLERIWKRLPAAYQPTGTLRYVFASRQLWGLAAIEDINDSDWDFLLKAAPDLRTRDFFERVGMDVSELPEDPQLKWNDLLTNREGFTRPETRDALYHLFVRHIEAFHAVRISRRDRVLSYLSSLNPQAQAVAMVDLGWHGSSCGQLTRLASALGWERPAGHYFATWKEASATVRGGARIASFFAHCGETPGRVALLRESVDLLESLFSAPHPSISDLSGNEKAGFRAIENLPDPRAADQISAVASIWEGVAAFCSGISELVPQPTAADPAPLAERALVRLLRFPQVREVELFADWVHVEGWGVARSRSILEPGQPEGATIAALREAGRRSHWRRGWWALLSAEQREQLLEDGFPA